jgi:hypothetical protein
VHSKQNMEQWREFVRYHRKQSQREIVALAGIGISAIALVAHLVGKWLQ